MNRFFSESPVGSLIQLFKHRNFKDIWLLYYTYNGGVWFYTGKIESNKQGLFRNPGFHGFLQNSSERSILKEKYDL